MPLSVIVHGGAWSIPEEDLAAHTAGCRAAALRAWEVLQAGGSALDAVEAAIIVLEDDPTFDAGTGSFLNAAGQVELDAGIMDGRTLRAGAAGAIHRVRNPISLARRILDSEHVLLVGPGATRFADAVGIPLCTEDDLVVERERARWEALRREQRDLTNAMFGPKSLSTVGAVVMDANGNIAAGTSTGGSLAKWPGRVGDVPLVGSGFYADNEAGGASSTGWGERITRIVMAKHAVDLMSAGVAAPQAAYGAIETLAGKVQGVGGIILLDREGTPGYAYNAEHMAYAYFNEGMAEPVASV